MSNKLYNDNSTPLVSVCPKCVMPLSFKQLKSIVLNLTPKYILQVCSLIFFNIKYKFVHLQLV